MCRLGDMSWLWRRVSAGAGTVEGMLVCFALQEGNEPTRESTRCLREASLQALPRSPGFQVC